MRRRNNVRTGIYFGVFALAMLGMGFAAVPLYRMFCQVTGFGGTTQRATEGQAMAAERAGAKVGGATVSVRFDANVDPDLKWEFRPEQVTEAVKEVHMPVLFFVDPAIRQDADAAPVEQITLSYTFHRAPDVPQ
jgi:cytochrome c oxidase assembly protein subunit 11